LFFIITIINFICNVIAFDCIRHVTNYRDDDERMSGAMILLYNLRPTTLECMHLVTRGRFRSRDKDGGHTIRSAFAENPMLHANLIALCFIA